MFARSITTCAKRRGSSRSVLAWGRCSGSAMSSSRRRSTQLRRSSRSSKLPPGSSTFRKSRGRSCFGGVVKNDRARINHPALFSRVIRASKLAGADLGLAQRPKPYSENELIRALDRSVTAKLIRGTRLIRVVAENQRADLAQRISMAIVEEYKRMNTEQRLGGISEANSVLGLEAARFKAKLQQSKQIFRPTKSAPRPFHWKRPRTSRSRS